MASADLARRALAAAALAAALAPAGDAAAYCRTSVCDGKFTAAVCAPAEPTDCGVPLYWPNPCVSFSIQQDASKQVSYAQTEQIVEQAFDAWMNVDCGGGAHPRIQLSNSGPVACALQEYNQDRGNANLIVYHDDVWPHDGASTTLALTTATYNLDTGEIYDADLEINSANFSLTTGDAGVQYDLLSIVTHETGHFLGLSHSADTDATMFDGYSQGTTSLRDLTADDVAGICAIYPPGEITSCDPTPRHGFSGLCGEDQPEPDDGGCRTAAAGAGGRGGAAAALAALALIGAALRRRAGRRCSS